MLSADPEFMLLSLDIDPFDCPEAPIEPEFCMDPEVGRPVVCADPAVAKAAQAADSASIVIRFIVCPLHILEKRTLGLSQRGRNTEGRAIRR